MRNVVSEPFEPGHPPRAQRWKLAALLASLLLGALGAMGAIPLWGALDPVMPGTQDWVSRQESLARLFAVRDTDPWGEPWKHNGHVYSSGPNRRDEQGVGGDDIVLYFVNGSRLVLRPRFELYRRGPAWICVPLSLVGLGLVVSRLARPRPSRRREWALIAVASLPGGASLAACVYLAREAFRDVPPPVLAPAWVGLALSAFLFVGGLVAAIRPTKPD